MTMEEMFKELMKEQREHGKQIAGIAVQIKGMQELQKQQNDMFLNKVNTRFEAFDSRCIRHNEAFEERQASTGRRMEEFNKRLTLVENLPAENALKKNKLVMKTVLVAIVSAIVGGIIGWVAHIVSVLSNYS